VKVWIYKGEVFPDQLGKAQVEQQVSAAAPERGERGERGERRSRRGDHAAS